MCQNQIKIEFWCWVGDEGFLDVIAAGNMYLESKLAQMRRQNPVPEQFRTHEDEEEVDRRSEDLLRGLRNNNNP